jgi:hypothetical protein
MSDVSTQNGNAKAKRNGKASPKARAIGKAVKAVAKASKPRNVDPAKLDRFGLRLNSLKSRAAALYAAKRGATLADVREAVGSTQFNVITELEGRGFKIQRDQVQGKGAKMATRYHLLAK